MNYISTILRRFSVIESQSELKDMIISENQFIEVTEVYMTCEYGKNPSDVLNIKAQRKTYFK